MLLRRHYGIGALEALHVLPAWEVDMLLSTLQDAAVSEMTGDPLGRVPDDLKGL